jgi:hypothetical protein
VTVDQIDGSTEPHWHHGSLRPNVRRTERAAGVAISFARYFVINGRFGAGGGSPGPVCEITNVSQAVCDHQHRLR